MEFGYIREWKEEQGQSTARQRLLELLDNERFLFSDLRDKSFERYNYLFMRNMLRTGDVLFLYGLDSLGCNVEDMVAEWRYLTGQLQVEVVVMDETFQMDSRVYKSMGEYGAKFEEQLLEMLLYADVLQQRREMELQRTRTVIKPNNTGRPPLPLDWELFHETAQRWADGEIDIEEACKTVNTGRSSWYRYTRALGYVRNNRRTNRKKEETK